MPKVVFAILAALLPPPSAGAESNIAPIDVVRVNETEYFVRTTAAHGGELWRRDGAESAAFMVKDINPGPAAALSSSSRLVRVDNVLFFFANDGVSGTELWRSDGTSDGTTIVKDIHPGPGGSATLGPLAPLGGRLLFFADDGENGRELWISDGSTSGTALVKDINAGPRSSLAADSQADIHAVGARAFFHADNGTTGSQLWSTDGTSAGTTMVTVCADRNALGQRWADIDVSGTPTKTRRFQYDRNTTSRHAAR
jgi:ELWxxDGT repeat protein